MICDNNQHTFLSISSAPILSTFRSFQTKSVDVQMLVDMENPVYQYPVSNICTRNNVQKNSCCTLLCVHTDIIL